MDEEIDLLMRNERNLTLFILLGLFLVVVGINLPHLWVFLPVVLIMVTAGIMAAFYGSLKYLLRRNRFLSD